jgi:hypothetical protein
MGPAAFLRTHGDRSPPAGHRMSLLGPGCRRERGGNLGRSVSGRLKLSDQAARSIG